jgi:general secretion pathway protein C
MRAGLLDRTVLAQTTVVTALTFAALVLLGLVLAYWTWAWFAPRLEPRTQPAGPTGAHAAVPTQAAAGLFGGARADRNGGAPAGIAIQLLGVVAATGNQPGYAVLRLDGRQTVAVREGTEIEPGIRLAQVHGDHVVLARGGAHESLAWPDKKSK